MSNPSNQKKWIISAWSVLTVLVVFSPIVYWVTNNVFGLFGAPTLKERKGPLTLVAPTFFGFVLHLIVLFFTFRYMMDLPLPTKLP